MIIEKITSGPFETNSYILGCGKTNQACIIDAPPDSADLLLKKIQEKKCKVVRILLTHSHQDHIADAARLQKHLGAPLCIHAKDAENLENPGKDGLPLICEVLPAKPDLFLQEADIFLIGEMEVHVIETPGHTPGGICFYLPKEGVLFSGDTLFKNSMGRIDFPQSKPSDMWQSLLKLSSLPSKTVVYPGHGPSTQIEKESWMKSAKNRFG